MRARSIFQLIISIIIAEAVGIIGGVVTVPAIASWYAGLVKPALNPPAFVFGPVWTALYALMAIAAFLVWQKMGKSLSENSSSLRRRDFNMALGLYAGQLVLNLLWSFIFFGLHATGVSLWEIVVLWALIVLTIVSFSKISKSATWLLVPYLVWVSFAIYLNMMIWLLN